MHRLRHVTDRHEWDAALLALPRPHALQSWDWGAFKERWGWQATRMLWEQGDRPVAAAQILRRRMARTPFTMAYAPRGPVLDFADTTTFEFVLSTLESESRRRRDLFVKIDPDVCLGFGAEPSAPEPIAVVPRAFRGAIVPRASGGAEGVVALLHRHGWNLSAEQIQFRNTVRVDLRPDEDGVLARMKPKTRYNIRLSERRGITIRPGSLADLNMFYELYRTTSQRDGFLIRPLAYYRDVWSRFLTAGRGHLLLAHLGDEAIAGVLVFIFGPTAWYMYGASSDAHREHMPSHLLQWHAMRLVRSLGCVDYDMWGAPDHFNEHDRMWGVYRFKTGFGGDTVRGLGAYDYSPRPWLYRLYARAMPFVLALMHRRHRGGTAGVGAG